MIAQYGEPRPPLSLFLPAPAGLAPAERRIGHYSEPLRRFRPTATSSGLPATDWWDPLQSICRFSQKRVFGPREKRYANGSGAALMFQSGLSDISWERMERAVENVRQRLIRAAAALETSSPTRWWAARRWPHGCLAWTKPPCARRATWTF